MNDWIQLNLIMDGGAAVSATVSREDAEKFIRHHATRQMPSTIGTHNMKCRPDVLGFSAETATVRAVFLSTAVPLQQHGYGPNLPPLYPNVGS